MHQGWISDVYWSHLLIRALRPQHCQRKGGDDPYRHIAFGQVNWCEPTHLGMPRLGKHKLCRLLRPSASNRAAFGSSGSEVIVVMETTQDRQGDDSPAAVVRICRHLRCSRNRLLDALMRPAI